MNVALVYNLIRYEDTPKNRLDAVAELDSEETIQFLSSAIEAGGHEVLFLEADESFLGEITTYQDDIDIVFNVAEGRDGDARESQVPIILEMLGIPYTGSGPLTLALCLDKVHTKEVLKANGISTGEYQAFDTPDVPPKVDLPFPLVVKLRNQGSSMGLSPASLVHDEVELKRQLELLHGNYGYPAFAEEYLPGREFTIPVLGNSPPFTLPIVENVYPEGVDDSRRMRFFEPDDCVAKRLGIRVEKQMVDVHCPAPVDVGLQRGLERLALAAYKALGCRDWCRLEIRLDNRGQPKVLELNPIAGIDPSYWLPRSAQAAGMSYEQLVNAILGFAVERHGGKLGRSRRDETAHNTAPGGPVKEK